MAKPKIVRRIRDGKLKWIVHPFIAKRDEDIEWSSDNQTEFRIWFPDNRNPLAPGPSESQNGTLTRKVITGKDKVPDGRYPYSVFCYIDNTMAEGGTSPEMEVVT